MFVSSIHDFNLVSDLWKFTERGPERGNIIEAEVYSRNRTLPGHFKKVYNMVSIKFSKCSVLAILTIVFTKPMFIIL